MSTPTISVVINTFNEERNLPFALRSVKPWVNEIIVVDMHSEDRTAEIAQAFGAKVFPHERTGFVEPARKFGIEQCSGEWILILDADEIIPKPLSEILQAISRQNETDIVCIPITNFVMGRAIHHSGYGQESHLRFFRAGFLTASSDIHQGLHPAAQARTLKLTDRQHDCGLVHFSYLDTRQYLEKLNRYTDVEAKQRLDKGQILSGPGAFVRVLKEFISRYLLGMGFRDGWQGATIALSMMLYRWAIYAKQRELDEYGGRDGIIQRYHMIADKYLAQYHNDGLVPTEMQCRPSRAD